MVPDRLVKAVRRRLKELGLPPSLVELDEFRDRLFLHKWVMMVRDGDKSADVHLVQPRKDLPALRRERANARRLHRNSLD